MLSSGAWSITKVGCQRRLKAKDVSILPKDAHIDESIKKHGIPPIAGAAQNATTHITVTATVVTNIYTYMITCYRVGVTMHTNPAKAAKND